MYHFWSLRGCVGKISLSVDINITSDSSKGLAVGRCLCGHNHITFRYVYGWFAGSAVKIYGSKSSSDYIIGQA